MTGSQFRDLNISGSPTEETPDQPSEDQMTEVFEVARRSALRAGAKPDEADDVAQDIVVKFLSNWNKLSIRRARSESSLRWRAFIATSARHRHIDLVRTRNSRQGRELQVFLRAPQVSDDFVSYLARLHVAEMIETLKNQRQRECMKMKWVAGLSIRQIAEVLGVDPQTVRFHLRGAHRALASDLGEPQRNESDA